MVCIGGVKHVASHKFLTPTNGKTYMNNGEEHGNHYSGFRG